MPHHFCVCILASERPLDAALFHVTAQLPSIHFGCERGTVRQAPIKALAVKNTDGMFMTMNGRPFIGLGVNPRWVLPGRFPVPSRFLHPRRLPA